MTIDLFEGRTLYKIDDEFGDSTTISLDKLSADVLQSELTDVHAWVQEKYDRVAATKPELTRREKGNLVRLFARRKAEQYPSFTALVDDLV